MNRYKSRHGMTSLSDFSEKLNQQLNQIKNRTRREDQVKTVHDFRALNDRNLEEYGLIERNTRFYTVKEIPFCNHYSCSYGRETVQSGSFSAECKRCGTPRRRCNQMNRLKLPTDATGIHFGMYEWDSSEQQERIRELIRWISLGGRFGDVPKSPSVLLWGRPGNGKTSLLYCLAKEAIFSDLKVKYISHSKLIDQKYKSFRGQTEDPLGRWLDNTDLLLFDELGGIGGGGQRTDWLRSFNADLFQDMYERWATGDLSIVVTTNLSPAQIEQYTGGNSAVMSRFRAMFGKPVKMIGRDRRASQQEDLSAWKVNY